jgi:glycosyltransferase involved in cell wall biosynthesis
MRFSFILCTRNSERVLGEVVESIISQKINNKIIEIILADYQSTDNTIKIAKHISKKNKIKFIHIKCDKPGKTVALELALDLAKGQYSVIVDDDTVLQNNYIEEAEKVLAKDSWGCLGSQGLVDKNLSLPNWFNEFKGNYAVGIPLKAKDWVWGACSIINMKVWKKLRTNKFEIQLNPKRINHTQPIEIGGEDTELSLAIYMLGYKVKFVENLKFIHKFEKKRLTKKYFLENVRGVCRSIPVLEIYRLVIYRTNFLFPKIFWILVLFKRIVGCIVRLMVNILTYRLLEAKYHYKIMLGIISGFLFFKNDFDKVYNRLVQIKKITSSSLK